MIRNIFFFLLFVLFQINSIYAQKIQWAKVLEFQYNQFAENEWSGKQVLGKPDALPTGQLNPKAFRLKTEGAFGTLIVSFATPQEIQQVIIVENYVPGRVSDIILHDDKGNKYPIYKSTPAVLVDSQQVLFVAVPRTNYKVKKVELNINTIAKKGWAQIDAIGIADVQDASLLNSESNLGRKVKVSQELSFSSLKENLGRTINTQYAESKPIISPDGKTLFFCRQNYTGNIGGKNDDQDIYYSDFIMDKWSVAQNMGSPLNDKYPNGVSSVTPDGNMLLLINEYSRRSSESSGVSMSYKGKNGWDFPTKVIIADHYNESPYVDYYITNSGKVLLLAVQRKDSYGDQDLYVSFLGNSNQWSAPINLGAAVNTSLAEFAPFLASDNKTLYFASYGHNGMGNSDIFYSKRLDETWQKWSAPQNIGKSVNTKAWEGYYSLSAKGDFAYFVTNAGGIAESRDIFRIALPKEFKPEPVLLVKGKVFNDKTKEPIESKIIFESLPSGKEEGIARSNPANGDYKIVLPGGKRYGFLAMAEGFISVNENIDLTKMSEYGEITQDLYLVPIEIGQIIKLNNIFFVQSKAELQPESTPELDRLYELLKNNPTMEIELGGHTDNQGVSQLNLELSQDRVNAIKKILVSKGIAAKRIETKAYGGIKPIASNATEETRKLNRRVDITILKK